jgi:hypothetical protein
MNSGGIYKKTGARFCAARRLIFLQKVQALPPKLT